MTKKYTLQEIQELVEKAEDYLHLEKQGKLYRLPCPLETMVYRVVPDCNRCTKVKDKNDCKIKLRNGCVKKVIPCVFTIDLVPDYGKTVFGTESEAVVISMS